MSSLTTTGVALVPQNMNEAITLADRMARAKLVPAALQNSPGDCLLVIEQAMRWGMSPFAVAQEVSVIQGKLMHSGKIVAAAINSSGVLAGRLQYNYSGTGDERTITVTGTLRGESQERSISVMLRDAATNNIHWKKQSDQQLAYYGSRVWARRYVPEVMLGVYAPEEFGTDEAPNTIDGHSEPVSRAAVSKAAQISRGQDIITNGSGSHQKGQPSHTANAICDDMPADLTGRDDAPAEPTLEDRVDRAIQVFASCMTHAHRQKAETKVRDLLFELDQVQREDLRNKLVDTMNFTMQRITKREAEASGGTQTTVATETGK